MLTISILESVVNMYTVGGPVNLLLKFLLYKLQTYMNYEQHYVPCIVTVWLGSKIKFMKSHRLLVSF